ncbi:MAG TPA: hypothetical protein VF543_11110 [Pyrinomonadaceae bacterium]|jgi:hypothetical protein
MLKKTLTLALVTLLILTTSLVMPVSAVPNNEKEMALARKVKADVMRLGQHARVRVKLKDDTKLEGYISEIAAEHFIVTDARSGTPTTIAYQEAKQVKRYNLSTGAKIGIVVAVAAAVAIIIAAVRGRDDNNKNGSPCTQPAQVGVPCPPGCVCIQ